MVINLQTKKAIMKKAVSVLIIMMVAVGLVFAGGGSEEDGVTIEFQQWWGVELPEGYLQNIVDNFYDETGITVKLLSAPYADTKTQIMSGISTGTVADIISVDGSWLYDFADQGVLTDMSMLMKNSGYNTANLNEQLQVNGITYALPVLNFAYPMYVNWNILNDCGITELPSTWSEFKEVSQIIVDNGYYPFALNLSTSSPSGIQNVYMGFAWASGLAMKNANGDFDLEDNEGLKEFAEFYKELYENEYLFPGMSSLTEADMTSKFASGELAFIVNSMAVLQAWRQDAPELDIGAIAIPVKDGYNGKSGMCVASWSVGITENSEHKEEAMMFIEYLFSGFDGTDGSINAGLAATQSAFPGSALAEPDYSAADPVFKDVFAMFQEGYPINEFTGMKEANTIMVDFINELIPYMEGDVDVDTYLSNVQGVIDEVYE